MITDWKKESETKWIFTLANGSVTYIGAYWVALYNGAKIGEWLSEQNAMLTVEMKHRETKTAKEASEIEGQ